MQNIINRIIENNLEDFKGLQMKGTIAVSEALLNEFIIDFLKKPVESPNVETPTTAPSIDFQKIIQGLDIKNLHLELQPQKMLVNIEVTK